jgi:hypothetical protein
LSRLVVLIGSKFIVLDIIARHCKHKKFSLYRTEFPQAFGMTGAWRLKTFGVTGAWRSKNLDIPKPALQHVRELPKERALQQVRDLPKVRALPQARNLR